MYRTKIYNWLWALDLQIFFGKSIDKIVRCARYSNYNYNLSNEIFE